MKVMMYVNQAYVAMNRVDAVSGHVQIPLVLCNYLAKSGYEMTLVTSQAEQKTHIMPIITSNVRVVSVVNATPPWPESKSKPGKAFRQALQLHRHCVREKYDLIHFWGAKKSGLLLGLITLVGQKSPSIWSPVQYRSSNREIIKKCEYRLLKQIDYIVPTSEYVAMVLRQDDIPVRQVIRPGVVKLMKERISWIEEHGRVPRKSVLFWRNANYYNGADIAIEVFRSLAPKYSEMDFVFAVRPYDVLESQIIECSREYPNIKVHIFPYSEGVTLDELLKAASCVLMPLRRLSLNPLMSILETLSAGVPVVTTDIEGNGELIQSGVNGLLVPAGDVAAARDAIERLIHDEALCKQLSINASSYVERNYSYDLMSREVIKIYQNIREQEMNKN